MEFSGADLYAQWIEGEFAHLGVGRDVRRGDGFISLLTNKSGNSGGMGTFMIRGANGGNEMLFIETVVKKLIYVLNDEVAPTSSSNVSPDIVLPSEVSIQSAHDDQKALLVMKRLVDDISLNIETEDLCPHTLVFTSGVGPDKLDSSEILVRTSWRVLEVLHELFVAVFLENDSRRKNQW